MRRNEGETPRCGDKAMTALMGGRAMTRVVGGVGGVGGDKRTALAFPPEKMSFSQ